VGLTMLASKQGLLLSFPSKFSYKAKSKLTWSTGETQASASSKCVSHIPTRHVINISQFMCPKWIHLPDFPHPTSLPNQLMPLHLFSCSGQNTRVILHWAQSFPPYLAS
jgi:hypothetical protein